VIHSGSVSTTWSNAWEGGQGVVFAGRGPVGERVAVQLLRGQFALHPKARERFVRELALADKVADFCTAQVLAADEGEGFADEAFDGSGGQAASWVREDDLVGLGEAEELPGDSQPPLPVLGLGRQEGLDVVDVGQCPVVFPPCGQMVGEVTDGG